MVSKKQKLTRKNPALRKFFRETITIQFIPKVKPINRALLYIHTYIQKNKTNCGIYCSNTKLKVIMYVT